MMKQVKELGLPILSVLLVCFYPCGFLFFQNAGEARAVDMLPFLGIFLVTAAAIFLLCALVLRNVARAAVLTDLGMLVVINFTMVCGGIKSVFPGFHNRIFLLLVAAVLLGLLVLLYKKKPNMTVICGLVALMFGVMTAVNGAMALPTLIAQATYHRSDVPVAADIASLRFDREPRNFYYMIFDEFGGPVNLEHYFGDPNEEFFSGLENRGFSVSRSSKNPESPWTVTLVPNMLNLDYVTDDTVPINNRLEWLEDPALYQLFRANGYAIDLVNHDNFLGETGCRVLTRDQTQETIAEYIYENSVFCQIPGLKRVIEREVLHRGPNSFLYALDDAAGAMRDCWRPAAQGPTLTVCYLVAPHAPFLFDENGRPTSPEDHFDWRKPELYMAKLRYINAEILETVDNIQAHDPNAVIVLQGDHGARTPGHLVERFGGPWFDTAAEIPYMENVLNCVYVPENPLDIEGDTCINATRKTLDAVYGLDLPPLPPPEDYTIPEEYMPPPPPREGRPKPPPPHFPGEKEQPWINQS